MIGSFLIPLTSGLLLVLVQTSTAQFDEYCSAFPPSISIFLPHPSQCDQFVRCLGGSAALGSCPTGLHFNPNQQMCDRPENVGCVNVNGIVDYTTTAPTERTTQPPCPTYESCPLIDSVDRTIHLPHISDCSLFCRCDHGIPKTDKCPPGLHFNRVLQVCDWPWSAKCQGACRNLVNNVGGSWQPESCVKSPSKLGDSCRLSCSAGYELSGSQSVLCTGGGWNGTGGLNVVPSCKTPKDLGEDFVDKINKTLSGIKAHLLFILDESGSVAPSQFEMEKTFVQALVNAFPLSENRSAGVITFSSTAAVDISISTKDTCSFLKQTSAIVYTSGGTDILRALNTAITEITSRSVHNKTLVFLITDGASSTNPAAAADTLKQSGHTLFTIGIANYERTQLEPLASSFKDDGSQLFFPVSSFEVFDRVAEYLKTAYSNSAVVCPTNVVVPTPGSVTSDPDATDGSLLVFP